MSDYLFVDANILLYNELTTSAFHAIARRRLEELEGDCVVCISNQIIREFLSGLTREMLRERQYDPQRITNRVVALNATFDVLEETAQTRRNLLKLLAQFATGGKQVHDANIVATMQQYGVRRLLTHNVDDFVRFASVIDVVPLITNVTP